MTPGSVSNAGKSALAPLPQTKSQALSGQSTPNAATNIPKDLAKDAVRVQISAKGRAAAAAQQTQGLRQPAARVATPPRVQTENNAPVKVASQPATPGSARITTPERAPRPPEVAPRVTSAPSAPERLATAAATPKGTTVQPSPTANTTANLPPNNNELAQAAVTSTQKLAPVQIETMRKSVQGGIFNTIV